MTAPSDRLPRELHPGSWWLWALGMATAASRTTNPLLLGVIVAVVGYVVVARRSDAPWSRGFRGYLMAGLAIIAIHVVFRVLFDGQYGEHVLFRLPQIPLPAAAAGIRIGGAVSLEGILAAVYEGLRLATLLLCVGAAMVLANPKRLLKSTPSALHEVGVAVTVALTVAPQLVESAQRVRRARKLRGSKAKGAHVLRQVIIPLMTDALERSLALAAAMDSRGYGRTERNVKGASRASGALVLTGLLGVCVGVYGLLDGTSPRWLGGPGLVLGLALAGAGFAIGGTRLRTTRYRPDPWLAAEWLVAASGIAVAVGMFFAGSINPDDLNPSVQPPQWPGLPIVPLVAILIGVLPAWLAPPRVAQRGARPRRPSPRTDDRASGAAARGPRMIRFEAATFTHDDAPQPVLRGVNLEVDEGELGLVIGRTGAGKSTLLGLVNGLVPHFTGGHLQGRVVVDGRDTRDHKPRDLADIVGFVGQDPLAGFVTDTVEEELAYGMEQLGLPGDVMRKRVEETLDLLGIAELRARPLRLLSGGQQQRVAIGSVLTAHPRILVLDEPTSALDPTAAEDVLAAIHRLVHDLGVTVLLAEHRLERIVHYADRVIHLDGDGTVTAGTPGDVLSTADIAPPVVQLGRLAGWTPPPLSVRDARRVVGPLRERLAACPQPSRGRATPPRPDAPALRSRKVVVRYDDVVAVREIDLDLYRREVVAIMGRNGSGKSSLLWALQGTGPRSSGNVAIDGTDPAKLSPSDARRLVGLVPQTPSDLLYLNTVGDECAQADHDADAPAGTCRALLDWLVVGADLDHHPRDLSEGQRLGLVLAVQLTAAPPIVFLDEPTRGLDPGAKTRFASTVTQLAADSRVVVIATHDVELVATVADRVIVLAEGEIVADGPSADIVCASPAFAPQVAKILAPEPWLTVTEIADTLADLKEHRS